MKFFFTLEVVFQRILMPKQFCGNAQYTILSTGRVLTDALIGLGLSGLFLMFIYSSVVWPLIRPRIKKRPKRSNSEQIYFCRAFFDAKGKFNSFYKINIEHICLGFADLTEIFLTKLDKPPKEQSPKKQSPKKISKNNLLEAISQSSDSDDDSSDDQFS